LRQCKGLAALLAILNALRFVVQRDLGSFEAIKLNNFFLLVALMLYSAQQSGVKPESAEPFLMLLGFLVLFPLSSDPLAKIPAERLSLWPINRTQRWALRVASLALSPISWIFLFLMARKAGWAVALSFLSLAVTIQALVAIGSLLALAAPRWNLLRHVPQPPGRLGGFVRNHMREMLCLLDIYLAILLSVGGSVYRLNAHADPAAFPVLSLLVVLALSTCTQSLFGTDFDSGSTRSHLLPLRGWEILLAKDMAFLAVVVLLVLPLSPLCGLAAGLAVLALGHHVAVLRPLPLRRWRFSSGRVLPVGILQLIACFAFGLGEEWRGPGVLAVATGGYLASLWFYGRLWEQRRD
jgi:hypothetical protein